MKNITHKSFSVKQLRRLFSQRIFAVPEIQREFVWNARKAIDLLDSIYRNLPIGTAMVWETGRERNLVRRALHILPPYDDRNKSVWYLIDGQQRLSVLYQVFEGKQILNASGREVDFSKIYFTIDSDVESYFWYLRRPNPNIDFQVTKILSPEWQDHFRKYPRYKRDRIEKCRRAIMDYQFHMIFVETNELEEVRESFIRINSRGTSVGAADRAFARATKFNLRHLVKELRTDLANGFGALPDEVVLQTIAFAYDIKDVGDRAIQSIVIRLSSEQAMQAKFDRKWHHIKASLQKAVDYLVATLGVINYGFLPSINMVTTLSMFFYYNNEAQPTANQKRELRKWFWATAVCQRYTGAGFRRNILSDVA